MNLQIRDPRARDLAQRLAKRRGRSMTDVVIDALEAEIEKDKAQRPLTERLMAIADDLTSLAQPGGRDLTREEIDDLWGHD